MFSTCILERGDGEKRKICSSFPIGISADTRGDKGVKGIVEYRSAPVSEADSAMRGYAVESPLTPAEWNGRKRAKAVRKEHAWVGCRRIRIVIPGVGGHGVRAEKSVIRISEVRIDTNESAE